MQKRDRLMWLASSTVPQALQHCEVIFGSQSSLRRAYPACNLFTLRFAFSRFLPVVQSGIAAVI